MVYDLCCTILWCNCIYNLKFILYPHAHNTGLWYMVSAVSYCDAIVPVQRFSINHLPKPSAHKLIFRISNTIRLVCVCVCVWYISYTSYIHVNIHSAQCYPLSILTTLIIFKTFITGHLFFWGGPKFCGMISCYCLLLTSKFRCYQTISLFVVLKKTIL